MQKRKLRDPQVQNLALNVSIVANRTIRSTNAGEEHMTIVDEIKARPLWELSRAARPATVWSSPRPNKFNRNRTPQQLARTNQFNKL